MKSKKQLAILLSKLKIPTKLDVGLEQYITPSEIAADILWTAKQDIEGKVVADLGCGNGILGIGASLLNAKKVFFLDIDVKMIEIARENASSFEGDFIFFPKSILDFNRKVDTVIMNPPFGIQKRKADKDFLEVAFQSAQIVFSLHSADSDPFLKQISSEYGFSCEKVKQYKFTIGHSYYFHTKPTKDVNVDLWVFRKRE